MSRRARFINVGDGHLLYVEEQGDPAAPPVLVLHDGPGIGCRTADHRLLAGLPYRRIFIDQRGAGRSQPAGELSANTTLDLVADLEQVRLALGIPGWVLLGGGWGSLLALAYARVYTESTLGLVLHGVFLGSAEEIAAATEGFQRWLAAVDRDFGKKMASTAGDPLAGLAAALSGDTRLARRVVCHLRDYRRSLVGLPAGGAEPEASDYARLAIELHYLRHRYFLQPGQLLAGIHHLGHLPTVIVQGLNDPFCPPATGEALHRAWPLATWMPVPRGGHGLGDPAIARACRQAVAWVVEAVRCGEAIGS